MEIAKQEVLAIEQTISRQADAELLALTELQLVMIGGGHGDIILG